jgi:hypothetical protein
MSASGNGLELQPAEKINNDLTINLTNVGDGYSVFFQVIQESPKIAEAHQCK